MYIKSVKCLQVPLDVFISHTPKLKPI